MRVSGDFFSSDCSGSLSPVPSFGETEGGFETLQTLGDGRGLGALVSLRQLVQFSLLRGFCDKAVPKLPGIFFKTFLKKFPG